MKIHVTFTEECLGTSSSNLEIHREFIASKAPDAQTREEEIAALGVDAVEQKAMTVFPKENGIPFLWDYQIKGFFKDACGMLSRIDGTVSTKLTAYKKIIDGLIFVKPRKIMLHLPKGLLMGNCQRPLRGQTAQGERISLANSETVPAGTTFDCEVVWLGKMKAPKDKSEKSVAVDLEELVEELLQYGELRGLLQWRNSGKGRFEYKRV